VIGNNFYLFKQQELCNKCEKSFLKLKSENLNCHLQYYSNKRVSACLNLCAENSQCYGFSWMKINMSSSECILHTNEGNNFVFFYFILSDRFSILA
jgi:hypothetical protein